MEIQNQHSGHAKQMDSEASTSYYRDPMLQNHHEHNYDNVQETGTILDYRDLVLKNNVRFDGASHHEYKYDNVQETGAILNYQVPMQENNVYINNNQAENFPVEEFPVGYRFVPKDHELISYYLAKKINDEPIPVHRIFSVNLYEFHPEELTGMYPQLGPDTWYFFTPRTRKYPNGSRPDRAAGSGYWKATGKDKAIPNDRTPIGFRQTLAFYDGKPSKYSKGNKTNWTMNEYRLSGPAGEKKRKPPKRKKRNADVNNMKLDDWVLCQIHLITPKSDKQNNEAHPGQSHLEVALVNSAPFHGSDNADLEQIVQQNVAPLEQSGNILVDNGNFVPRVNQDVPPQGGPQITLPPYVLDFYQNSDHDYDYYRSASSSAQEGYPSNDSESQETAFGAAMDHCPIDPEYFGITNQFPGPFSDYYGFLCDEVTNTDS